MGNSSDTTTLLDYLHVLSARRWMVIGVTLISIAIGVLYSVLATPTYVATAEIQFQNQKDVNIFTEGVPAPVDVNPIGTAVANSRIVTRPDVVGTVQQTTKTGMTDAQLRGAVTAVVEPTSSLIDIQASTSRASLSADLANAFANATKKVVASDIRGGYIVDASRLRAALRQGGLDATTKTAYRDAIARLDVLGQVADPVTVTRLATAPGGPSSPKPVLDTILAGILGLIVGIAAAFAANALDRRLYDQRQVEHELGWPLVGHVNADTLGLSVADVDGDAATRRDGLEAFRVLRTNVAFLAPDRAITSVVVTSAVAEEGKSTVASWFAYVNAASGRRTLLVDADLRRPVLAERFSLGAGPGLTEYLAGDTDWESALHLLEVHGGDGAQPLALLPAGASVFDPSELLGSERFQRFVGDVLGEYELVVFDSAPLLPVSDTLELVLRADAVLMCARLEQTTRRQLQSARDALRHLPERPTGVVVTGIRRGSDDYYYGYYSSKTASARTEVAVPLDRASS
jgi:succinoglycan biosynthesis transport protein ExoP